ncbi:probable G-protein coupled receptor B0563.6 [Eurytemora carolleeae]|uniref:probable G-protein coupled receptor B0563.6 n=1 Tax=Eurytemora carolleeae TaxID=1294199 RepID=UPI000C792C0F|nr:probable G-protein coupled receptor B0563.6 [Eurytemora carolleeae]|eukprot:XP_023337159.1 probable G-protein coupled receptor B0563.6 [Eurytemora affinis]
MTGVCILGILGNLTSLIVLRKMKTPSLFYRLLFCLCVADLLHVFFNLLETPPALGLQVGQYLVYTLVYPYLHCTSHFLTTVSVLLIMSIVLERFQAACRPTQYLHRVRRFGQGHLFRQYFIPTLILSAVLSIPKVIY